MTDDARAGGRAIDAATLARVHAMLERHGVDLRDPDLEPGTGFVVLNLNDYCLAMAVIDGFDGTIVDTVTVRDVGAESIDAAVATRLADVGRVQPPTHAEWGAELRRLVGSGRERLSTSDGAFIMGEDFVRLFRLTRNDVRGAISGQIDVACTKWNELIADRPVCAAVLGASPESWPGIIEIASAIVPPALMRVSVTDEQSETLPPMQPAPRPAVMARHGVDTAAVSDTPPDTASAPPRSALMPADPPTDRIPVQTSRPTSHPVSELAAAVTPARQLAHVDLANLPQWSLLGEHSWNGAPTAAESEAEPIQQRRPPTRNRRTAMIGALACAALIGVGAAFAFALSDTGASSSAAVDNSASTRTGATPPASIEPPEPSYAAPDEVDAAGQPAVPYTTPPPPPPTTSRSESSSQRPTQRNPPRPRPQGPRRNTIPNPIPGLPPIILPG